MREHVCTGWKHAGCVHAWYWTYRSSRRLRALSLVPASLILAIMWLPIVMAQAPATGSASSSGSWQQPEPEPEPEPAPPPAPITCEFETNAMCGWTQCGAQCTLGPTCFLNSTCFHSAGRNRWIRGFSTPSSSTGASRAHQNTGYFMYLETSSPSTTGWTSYLVSPVFSGMGAVSFYYHMHGATMGTLAVESRNGTTWQTVWSRAGQQQLTQQSLWLTGRATFLSTTVQVRFKAVAGSSYTGDASVDSVIIYMPLPSRITNADFATAVSTCLAADPTGACDMTSRGSMTLWDVSAVTNMSRGTIPHHPSR
eukprot:COSAG01_NODE_7400_length_3222_cov_2.875760_3_plen_310_part_00